MKSVILYTLLVAFLMVTQVQAFSWDKWAKGRNWGRSLNVNYPATGIKDDYKKWKQAKGKIA